MHEFLTSLEAAIRKTKEEYLIKRIQDIILTVMRYLQQVKNSVEY